MGVFEGTGKIRVHDGGGLEYSLDGGATWTTAGGGFGQDTQVKINNSAAVPVVALELVVSLTTATAGSEVSQWLLELLNAGLQVSAVQIGPNQVQFPAGTTALPGVSFLGHAGYGMDYDNSAFDGLSFSAGGTEILKVSKTFNGVVLASTGAILMFSQSQTEFIQRSGTTLRFVTNNAEIMRLGAAAFSVFGVTAVARQTGGVATAGASYTSTEQGMINRMYTALQNYGFLT